MLDINQKLGSMLKRTIDDKKSIQGFCDISA
jgi:hypothetical protein